MTALRPGGGFEDEAAAAEAARAAAASVGLNADEVNAAVLAALTAFSCFSQNGFGQTAGSTAGTFRVNATAATTAMTTIDLTSALSEFVNGRRRPRGFRFTPRRRRRVIFVVCVYITITTSFKTRVCAPR